MTFENRYTLLDRVLHRVAFATRPAQAALSDLESNMFSEALASMVVDRPTFITGLPRAGTTVLLEIAVASGEFVSHTYRDMPFVMLPMLWRRFSRRFRRDDERRERAHGDGILIDVDSPEALEEMLWLTFWSSQYLKDRIAPWNAASDADFEHFFREHIKKVLALRASETGTAGRYVSKNNLNIARVGYLKNILPDAMVVVPFRSPMQQAASLRKQHLNFLQIHRQDPFTRSYMKGLGHFDFGANLKPVDFDNWLTSSPGDATKLEFWLEYWTATYSYLRDTCGDEISFLCFDRLCDNPDGSLVGLAAALEIQDAERLIAQASRLATPVQHEVNTSYVSTETATRAAQLYAELCARDRITIQ